MCPGPTSQMLGVGNEFGENLIAMGLADAVGLDFPGRKRMI